MRKLLPTLPLLFSAMLCASCGDGQKPVFAARGRVLWNGKAVPEAFVALHPLDQASGERLRPCGRTDRDGWFLLNTYSSEDGAPAGEYAVTVEWRQSVNPADEGNASLGPNRLPVRYSKPSTTPLRVRIVPGENDLGTFQIAR
jgi:hypothetical protein